ncbi:MAG TPA: SDR family oxidoreductase [Vicinamibacterales bacterium]|nr:SDR family oxidoreductase [Vicinamibacterales bacterium]
MSSTGGDAKTVLVTGAASGIGAACCARFLMEGWTVHGWDVVAGDDERVRYATVDVSDWDAVEGAAAAHDGLDAVVHCAAIARLTPILEMSRQDWDRTIAINLNGSFYVARHLFPALDARDGVFVQVASVNSKNTTRFRAPYNASKAGVVSLTQALAVEWALAGSKVRVLAVSPGITRTPQPMLRIETGAITEEMLLGRVPTHRWIEPEEIAGAIFQLTGNDFTALHGGNVFLDAGYDAWGGHF